MWRSITEKWLTKHLSLCTFSTRTIHLERWNLVFCLFAQCIYSRNYSGGLAWHAADLQTYPFCVVCTQCSRIHPGLKATESINNLMKKGLNLKNESHICKNCASDKSDVWVYLKGYPGTLTGLDYIYTITTTTLCYNAIFTNLYIFCPTDDVVCPKLD